METIIVTGPVTTTDRLTNSRDGNPRWRVGFATGENYPTEADANVNYGITSRAYREAEALTVTLNSRLHITHITIGS